MNELATASPRQLRLLRIYRIKKHLIVAHGAIRSGKTLFLAYGFAILINLLAVSNPVKGQNRFGLVGQANVTETQENVAKSVIQMLKLLGWRVKNRNSTYLCKKGKLNVRIDCYSMNNKVSYKRLQGGTFRAIFLDEAPLMDLDAIQTAIGRCVDFHDYKVVMTGNPEGTEQHPFYVQYISKDSESAKKVFKMHFKLTDNPNNGEEKISFYKALFTDSMFKRKILGLWVASTGAIYKRFTSEHIKGRAYNCQEYAIGVDYGEMDGTSATLIGFDGYKHIHAYDQYYHRNESDEKDINDYAADVFKFIQRSYALTGKVITVYVDSANLSFFKLLKAKEDKTCIIKKAKKQAQSTKYKSAIQERIDFLNMCINANMFTISSNCKELIQEITNATYDDKGNRLDNATYRVDGLDSLEYAFLYNLNGMRKFIIERVEAA